MTIPGGFVAGVALPAADMNLLPAGLEGGGYAQITANQGSITTIADVTGLTVTWTAVTGRSYRIAVQCEASSTVAADVVIVAITDPSNTIKTRATTVLPTATVSATLAASVIESGLSGSTTRKVRAQRALGTGTITLTAAATFPAFILVLDIGPT